MGGGMMAPILSIATGLLIFVILIIFAPTIAGSVEDAQPTLDNVTLKETCHYTQGGTDLTGACETVNASLTTAKYDNMSTWNEWNISHNGIPTGTEVWVTNIQILGVVILIISIAVAMYFLKGMA